MNKWEKLKKYATTIYIDVETGEILKNWKKLKQKYRKIEFWETKEIKEKNGYRYIETTRNWTVRQHEQYRLTF